MSEHIGANAYEHRSEPGFYVSYFDPIHEKDFSRGNLAVIFTNGLQTRPLHRLILKRNIDDRAKLNKIINEMKSEL